jgi:hypothetical protein
MVCGVVGSHCWCFIKQMPGKRNGHIHVNKHVQIFWNISDFNEYTTRDTSSFRPSIEAADDAAHFYILWTALLRVVLAAQDTITADKQEKCTSERLGGRLREIEEEAETVGKTWRGLGNSWQQSLLAVLCTGSALSVEQQATDLTATDKTYSRHSTATTGVKSTESCVTEINNSLYIQNI